MPYAKALPAPVATLLAMRKLPLSQWGAVRVTHNHSAIAITSSGVGARHKNMSNMVLGKVPKDRRAPNAHSARQQRHVYFSSHLFLL